MPLFLLLATIGFLASVAVHASTYLPDPPLGMRQTWFLHVGIFLTFIPAIAAQRDDAKAGPGDPRSPRRRQQSLAEQFPYAPRWARALLGVCFVYALVNFAVFMVSSAVSERNGSAVERDGRYYRHHKGAHAPPDVEISPAEYRLDQARVARGFSGHWMVFYCASAVMLWDGMRRRHALRPPPELPAVARSANPYERAPAPRLTPWAHSSLVALLTIVGWLGGPLLVMTLVLTLCRGAMPSGLLCAIVPLFFGSAVVGGLVIPRLIGHHLPARCPRCGGRAFPNHSIAPDSAGRRPVVPNTYRCADCGRLSRTDGSEP